MRVGPSPEPWSEGKLEEEVKEDAPVKERINILQKHLDLEKILMYKVLDELAIYDLINYLFGC